MALKLKELDELSEDQSSDSRTHRGSSQTTVMPSSGLGEHSHHAHTGTYT